MLKNNTAPKKKAMLAQKEQILQEIEYYEQRIKEFSPKRQNYFYEGNSSSDSEDDFPTILDFGPSISELKHQERQLRINLQATQELTGVGVLQSEVNVMVQDPVIEGGTPVTETGTWREVTAECRIDLVPFSLTFYSHQPSRRFAPSSYHGLRVLPVKTAQEAELSKSVLAALSRPSDAVEVLRSYAVAYRSRRTTLARLADKYANSLFMEPMTEGGFVLKCANLLEMSWRLENKLSAVAPFHHKMNFELDYMDESYLKIIKQSHRQLSDPTLQTDERTHLLSKIISTCLEAQAQTQESMESDQESVKKHEKTTLDEDIDQDMNENGDKHKQKRDEEVMAPPKSIPKKTKPKGKENKDENRKSVKRGSQVDGNNAKKARMESLGSVSDIIRRISDKNGGEKKVSGDKVTDKESNVDNATEKVQKQSKNANKTADKPKNSGTFETGTEKAQKQSKNSDKVVDKPKNFDKKSTKTTEDRIDDKNAGSKDIVTKNAKDTKTTQDNAKKTEEKDITTKKVAKNDKTTKTNQVESNIEKNNDPVNKIAEKNKAKSTADAKTVKNADKKEIKNHKTTKTAKNEVANKENNDNPTDTEKNTKNEKTNATSKAKAKTAEPKISTENTKNTEPKNSKDVNKKIEDKQKKSDANVKNAVNSKAANERKNVNSDTANVMKNVNSDTAKVKKNYNSDAANVKKNANSDAANVQKNVNSDTANVKKSVHSDAANFKKNVNSVTANVKRVHSDTANVKKNVNSNIANVKSVNPKGIEKPSKLIATKNKENLAEPKKNADKKKETENLTKVTNVATTENAKPRVATNKVDIKKTLPKNNPAKISNKNAPKNQEKPKMLLKNHRKSIGSTKNVTKSKLNISKDSKISKIPQKKLSPAFAAVLKQNPIRMSPRMLSKFKSPSDTNLQAKIFKTTNIPRLLKKPAPKSK